MTRKDGNRENTLPAWKNTLMFCSLFTAIGICFYLLITGYDELADRAPDIIFSVRLPVAIVVVFNLIGFCLIKVNEYFSKRRTLFFGQTRMMAVSVLVISLILLVFQYLIIVSLKIIIGMHPYFVLQAKGLRIIAFVWLLEMIVVVLLLVIHSTRNNLSLFKEKESLKRQAEDARYKALVSQLNPHFLFNSLNTLIAEIQYDPANAVEFTRNLSDVFRYVLQQQDKKFVTLKEEMFFLNSYIFLQKVRSGDCIDIECGFGGELLEAKLPPLTIQLLAENIVKHNFIDEGHRMKIGLSASDDGKYLTVWNTVCPKHGEHSSGKGLQNLSERYRLLCGEEIEIRNTDGIFSVKIPLMYE